LIALWLFRRDAGGGLISFWRFIAPEWIWRHPSVRIDLAVIPLNALALAVPGIFAVAAPLAAQDASAAQASSVSLWLILSYTAVLFLVDDFMHYAVHWMFHRVPVLWAFHKVHHSAEVLTPLTADRFHPVELLIVGSMRTSGLVLVTLAFGQASAGLPIWTIFGANALLFAFNLFAGALRHSHVWFAFPPALSRWLVSPAMHQIHHSAEERHWDKNMGGSLAVWDRLVGTLYVPVERERFALGVGPESARYRNLSHCYLGPFAEAATGSGIPQLVRRLRHANRSNQAQGVQEPSGELADG
jgi:sterol desaturase/sphingolipid hydroxylase (fatty acid hydroxylase superfamily)